MSGPEFPNSPSPIAGHEAHTLQEGSSLPWYDIALLAGGIALFIISWVSASHAGIFQHMNAHTTASIASWTAVGAIGLSYAFTLRIISHIQDIKQKKQQEEGIGETRTPQERIFAKTSSRALYHRNAKNFYFGDADFEINGQRVSMFGIFPGGTAGLALADQLQEELEGTSGNLDDILNVLKKYQIDVAITIPEKKRVLIHTKKYILIEQGGATKHESATYETTTHAIEPNERKFFMLTTHIAQDNLNPDAVYSICQYGSMSQMNKQLIQLLPKDNVELGYHIVNIGKELSPNVA